VKATNWRHRQWADLRSKGWTLRAIADLYGVTHQAVAFAMRLRDCNERNAHNLKQLRRKKPSGVGHCSICGKSGHTKPTHDRFIAGLLEGR
jgi:hypothetical protein